MLTQRCSRLAQAWVGTQFLCSLSKSNPKVSGAFKALLKSNFTLKVRLMEEKGYVIGNLDCTIIAQKPKLSPHKANIRSNLSRLLKADAVNVKAKTHEKVDSIGEERSI